ncbi:MAG: hypothetical protein A3C93_00990 [Candidatus Lloydbacteria bacterium RIFCSPHIGHO2_02_FULL_54_17]|uniref:GIY-YIG domain-containing protein n=1 Tax=Candidatus Lloydbacteria bacterium RIFCSPHIGHO2_02_FULL_54_17 TaxID=1798664 RepID=A0A1G2DJY2_9BACT|nr:MAG: hypothetical protein A2762_04065 [Candidatus Lloydbacteria bacterium RIFCSPHIGHO2_01_FULL_54_11]OGZ13128.1 MAG: hypothetical protein A3C93_00990 [Candidatus Lloydbacteria bacterium RIFCSPHIGHO2_02_FULL_54_17]OGZ13343.1 MAG: hypothetical protein A2948_04155 [Candidatus Lloydbacteria bacterium RIFCSPLOWO2_01_FULL_54_18]
MFYYTYILRSKKDGKWYTGYTHNLRSRFKAHHRSTSNFYAHCVSKKLWSHNKGLVEATKHRLPFDLIYYEACLNQQDATHREKYLKTYKGKLFLKNRLRSYFTG